METDLTRILEERGGQYGDFTIQAELSQELKSAVQRHPNYETLIPFQKEALDMILHKISRIVNGNPDNPDSWLDIEGYARIARERLNGK